MTKIVDEIFFKLEEKPIGSIKILLIVLSKYYFSTLFGSFLL